MLFYSGVLVELDSNDVSEVKKTMEYFGKLSDWRPIKTALLDDGLLLVYENSDSECHDHFDYSLSLCVFNGVIKGTMDELNFNF